ncbi:MAG: hypothetical protein U0232_04110 [Thermomicrobiales bacterium]
MLFRLLSGMDRRRSRSVVVSLTPGGALAIQIQALGIPVHNLGMERGQPTFRALPGPRAALLRRERPQLCSRHGSYHATISPAPSPPARPRPAPRLEHPLIGHGSLPPAASPA